MLAVFFPMSQQLDDATDTDVSSAATTTQTFLSFSFAFALSHIKKRQDSASSVELPAVTGDAVCIWNIKWRSVPAPPPFFSLSLSIRLRPLSTVVSSKTSFLLQYLQSTSACYQLQHIVNSSPLSTVAPFKTPLPQQYPQPICTFSNLSKCQKQTLAMPFKRPSDRCRRSKTPSQTW